MKLLDILKEQTVINNECFGTERVSLFLYSLVRMEKPKKILEIGAGLTTFYLAAALFDLAEEDKKNFELHNNKYKDLKFIKNYNKDSMEPYLRLKLEGLMLKAPSYSKPGYFSKLIPPKMITVDDGSDPSTNMNFLEGYLVEMGLSHLVSINNEKLCNYLESLQNETFDFIWVDAGGADEYKLVESYCQNILNKNGIICFHSTTSGTKVSSLVEEMRSKVDNKGNKVYENMTLVEPDKYLQNSISVFKRTTFRENLPLQVEVLKGISFES